MRLARHRVFLVLMGCAALHAPLFGSIDVLHMNLQDLSLRADKIFRGTVLSVEEGSVTAGGGEIPTATYRVRVDEALKGTFDVIKDDIRIVDIQMVGRLKEPVPADSTLKLFPILPELPKLKVGREYLLLTTPPSPVGLSTTVGLGQGCFKLFSLNKEELAVNELNNAGLFKGMDVPGFPPQGPVSYIQLAELIRDLVAGGK